MPIYPKGEKAVNANEFYSELFERRGVERVQQFKTIKFNPDLASRPYSVTRHVWSAGDKYYKLAYEHYGSLKYWWVIALFNGKPTDAHVEYGDEILIPFPVDAILGAI